MPTESLSDGTKLLTCGADKTCRLWQVPAADSSDSSDSSSALPKCVKEVTFSFGAPKPGIEHMQVGCLFVGERMVSLSLSGDINVLDVDNPGTPKAVLTGHPKAVSALTGGGEGRRHVYSSSLSALQGGDNMVCRWTPGAGCDLRLGGERHVSEVRGMACAKEGGDLLTVGLDDTCRRAPTTPGGGAAAYEADGLKLASQPRDVDVSADGSLAVIATLGGVVTVSGGGGPGRDQNQSAPLAILSDASLGEAGAAAEGSCAGIRPDGGELAVGGKDAKVRVFAVEDGGKALVPGAVLERHRGEVTGARYSPDGTMLATCDSNREVLVW